jgi:hypothetical protein
LAVCCGVCPACAAGPGRCNRSPLSCVPYREVPGLPRDRRPGSARPWFIFLGCCVARRGSCGETGVTAKTIPRHARTLERRRWVSRPGEGRLAGWRASGVSQPGLADGRGGADPLAGPVAVTGRAVLGDRIRRPTAWCEMAACISRYEDPAALGEADIRARALAAGWRHDAVGRLVCPYCQRRGPALWASSPAAPRGLPPARGPGQDTDHARAGRISAVWSALSAWYQDVRGRQDWRREWLRLLAALAVGGNGWNTPPPRGGGPNRNPMSCALLARGASLINCRV